MTDDNTVENLTVRVLQGIRQDLHDLRGDVNTRMDSLERATIAGFDGLTKRVNGLEEATIAGFEGVHERLERLDTRLEGIRDLAGNH